MIIGNWFLANIFVRYKDIDAVCIFASGVSNSQNQNHLLFQRETDLLLETLRNNKEKLFIYFSTCSIYDPTLVNSEYVKHKLKIENLIEQSWNTYIIFRISNPVGYTSNPNTIFNYLINKINAGENFVVWSGAKRNLIDIDDLCKIASYIIDHKSYENIIINIANTQNFAIVDIVTLLEHVLWKKALYSTEEKWGIPVIDLSKITDIIKESNVQFDNQYLEKLIHKYCWI